MEKRKKLNTFATYNIFGNDLMEHRYSDLVDRVANSSLEEIKEYYYRLHETETITNDSHSDKNAPWSDKYEGVDEMCCTECDLLKYAIQHCKKNNLNKDFKKWFPNV